MLSVYLAFFLALVGIGFLLANPISNQVAAFSGNVPHLVRQANSTLAELQTTLNNHGIHVQFIKQGETALQTLGDKVVKGSSSIVSFGGGLLTEVVTGGFDVLLVFVLSIYMLVYGPRIGRLVRRVMPAGDGTPEDDYPTLVQTRRRALRRRPAAVQPDHGRHGRPVPVPVRRPRASSRRARSTPSCSGSSSG